MVEMNVLSRFYLYCLLMVDKKSMLILQMLSSLITWVRVFVYRYRDTDRDRDKYASCVFFFNYFWSEAETVLLRLFTLQYVYFF